MFAHKRNRSSHHKLSIYWGRLEDKNEDTTHTFTGPQTQALLETRNTCHTEQNSMFQNSKLVKITMLSV